MHSFCIPESEGLSNFEENIHDFDVLMFIAIRRRTIEEQLATSRTQLIERIIIQSVKGL